jgi:hypothetical protein
MSIYYNKILEINATAVSKNLKNNIIHEVLTQLKTAS